MKYTFYTDDAFTSKVRKTNGCWEWIGGKNSAGYGQINVKVDGRRTTARAHRVAYELAVGPIPEGMQIDHTCHNRPCVNPSHMRLVTIKQNAENKAGPPSNNTSGYRGVSWIKANRKWRALTTHGGKQVYLGLFDTAEEAHAAVLAKRLELHTHNDLDRKAVAA